MVSNIPHIISQCSFHHFDDENLNGDWICNDSSSKEVTEMCLFEDMGNIFLSFVTLEYLVDFNIFIRCVDYSIFAGF